MALFRRAPGKLRAVIFDLDEALLATDSAWTYTVEEAVASVTGKRTDASALATEYRRRPWRQALMILVDSPVLVDECESLCPAIYERSAMKRLLVQEGVGMALDVLRAASIEIGAISRAEHRIARRQLDSTGLDRFLTVLSATPEDGTWEPAERIDECRDFLGRPPEQCAFVSSEGRDLEAAATVGYQCFEAGWTSEATEWRRFPCCTNRPRSNAC